RVLERCDDRDQVARATCRISAFPRSVRRHRARPALRGADMVGRRLLDRHRVAGLGAAAGRGRRSGPRRVADAGHDAPPSAYPRRERVDERPATVGKRRRGALYSGRTMKFTEVLRRHRLWSALAGVAVVAAMVLVAALTGVFDAKDE